MATPSEQPGMDVSQVLRRAVERTRWTEVIELIGSSDCSDEQRHWAIIQTMQRAPGQCINKRLDAILDCAGDQMDIVLSHLTGRGLWRCVGRVLKSDIIQTQRSRILEDVLTHAGDDNIVEHILPNCLKNEELEHVITILVSRGLWKSVGEVLRRGVSTEQHRRAVEQASRQARGELFTKHILHHCTEDQLEQVLTHMVSRGLWKPLNSVSDSDVSIAQHVLSQIMSQGMWEAVGRFIQRYISTEQHRWAVEQAIRRATDDDFVHYILPLCRDEELDHVITHLGSRGLWRSVGKVLGRGVSTEQNRWAVEQASRQAHKRVFTKHILNHCTEDQLEQVLTHMVSRGLWKPLNSVTDSDVSITQHVLSQIMSRGMWRYVGRFIQRYISTEQHRWAVEQASRLAGNDDFVRFILPKCRDEELDHVITNLVSRGLWRSVGKVLGRGVSTERPRWAVEQASRHVDDDDFVHHILPQCHDEELDHVITHLVSRGLWRSVGEVLGRGVSTQQHRWAVEQAAEHANKTKFDCFILPHCFEDDLIAVFPIFVASREWNRTRQALYDMVTGTLHSWLTLENESTAHVTLFWKFMHHCRVGASQAMDLTKEVTTITVREKTVDHRHRIRGWTRSKWCTTLTDTFRKKLVDLSKRVFWHRPLCETLMTSLLHTLCYVMCSDDSQYTDSTEHTKQCVSDIYTHITACIADNTDSVQGNTLKTVQNKQKWTSVFTEIADTHQTDPLFLLHFLQGLNLYHVSRRGKNDDAILLVMLAVFPLFPQLQSVALRVMLREERWDVISQACLSHVWEHDRRRLFKAAVLQRRWSVVRQWSDHTVHDDEREWVMKKALIEALREKAFKEVSKEALKEKVFKETFRVAFKKAFKKNALKQAFSKTLKEKAFKFSKVDFDEKIIKEDFKEAFKGAFKEAFKEKTFKEAFKKKVFNEKAFKEMAIKEDFKEEVLKEAVNESFKGKVFKETFKEKATKEAFTEETFKVAIKLETLKDYFKDEAFKEAFKKKAFDGEALTDVFKETFKEEDFKEAFKKVFTCFEEGASISLIEAFREAFREKAFISLIEAFKESLNEEEFKETLTEKWMVYLLLADHGLTPPEQMHAHYMVAKYGNWGTVKQMVERGGDLTEVSNLLENWVTGRLRKKPEGDATVYMERCEKLIRTRLGFAKDAVLSPMKALERWRWGSVLFYILHQPTDHYFSLVIDKLIAEEEWHILMHLVRLGMNKAERSRLFPEMVRQQQWGVCRMLLEHGVDEQLCVEALPELMERNQWTLVARVMDYNVDDAVRRQVMQWAFHRRAGVLFWHCLNVMEDKQPLTKETRVKLFHQAISRDIWQAVKPLVEEKDGPGFQRRDMAFLEAIEQHLWDVVEYCQLHGADINMKDENGETPLHREARKEEWIAVKEIVLRDGKPNLLDKAGVSVLNRLIDRRQWDIVKFVIMYGADIHLPARYSEYDYARYTPLQALIDARRADIIKLSITWCGDQKKGVNDRGETCVHVVCDSDIRWDVMEDLMVRRVDPLAVTRTGKSPLVYAVLNRKCPERMVAECSRLGFSSHQPSVNGPQESLLPDIIHTVVRMWTYESKYFDCRYMQQDSSITSPLVCAVLRDSPVLVHMLYESASCSRTEVVTLYTQLPRLTDVTTEEGSRLQKEVQRRVQLEPDSRELYQQRYRRLTDSIEKHADLLRELDTTPRTLLSSCRLLVLQHFHFSDKDRLLLLGHLPLSKPMKDYLEFSDLRDPNYGENIGLPSEDTLDDEELSEQTDESSSETDTYSFEDPASSDEE